MKKQQKHTNDLEDRVDLSNLPCICVDSAKAAFRDDAISIRPRASTGRPVLSNSSKWEILLHIVDVSDIYATPPVENDDTDSVPAFLRALETAAASRGSSRYDLPRGPLHMLPINVLQSLSLEVFKPDWSSAVSLEQQLRQADDATVNRCVTVWVHVDDQSGKVLDAGLERTLISRPVALSFQAATSLLEGRTPASTNDDMEDPMTLKMRAILKVVEQHVHKWSDYRHSTSRFAKKKEDRRSSYEKMSKHAYGSSLRDDGRDGFQRTRGHLLVDKSMDLYSYTLNNLVKQSGGSLPQVIGASDGRVGTGPLRRYIDGVVQRQALSVLCGFGGEPLSRQQCVAIGRQATEVRNRVTNSDALKQGPKSRSILSDKLISQKQQHEAVRMLKIQIKNLQEKRPLLPAMSTGKGSEVLLMGVGAVARCRGIKGTLPPGTEVQVRIERIDEQNGTILTILEEGNFPPNSQLR